MRAALRHRDRVRGISLIGPYGDIFKKFMKATNYNFPALESLIFCFPLGRKRRIPVTFLRGPNQSDLPLRRLGLHGGPLAYVSRLLLSETTLTDLALKVTPPKAAAFGPTQGMYFLPCLQRMQCLRNLDLNTLYDSRDGSPWYYCNLHLGPKVTTVTTVPMPELTRFHYHGGTALTRS